MKLTNKKKLFISYSKKEEFYMSKVVILGGNARSGKSTLSYRLTKNGFSRISFDNIFEAIKNGLKIEVDKLSKDLQFAFFENVVNKAIEEAECENVNTVIDMYDFLPEDIFHLKNKDKVDVYFLAYPNCSIDEIRYNVIHFSKPTDWIAQVNEEYLESCVKRFDERNKLLVHECKKYEMNLIDTRDGEERDIVLDKLFKHICLENL